MKKLVEIEAIDYILKWIENVGATYDMEVSCYEEEFKKIKQDLEVLEILQVLILHNGKSVGYKGIIRDFEVMLRLEKITKEQLDKLKQWLEENENDN